MTLRDALRFVTIRLLATPCSPLAPAYGALTQNQQSTPNSHHCHHTNSHQVNINHARQHDDASPAYDVTHAACTRALLCLYTAISQRATTGRPSSERATDHRRRLNQSHVNTLSLSVAVVGCAECGMHANVSRRVCCVVVFAWPQLLARSLIEHTHTHTHDTCAYSIYGMYN